MATQSIEVKDFTGGRNFVTNEFNLYPTEGSIVSNMAIDSTGMRTRNIIPDLQIIAPRVTEEVPEEGPIQVAPKIGEVYDLSYAYSSYLEKVRFYQGNRYIIKSGTPYMLGDNNTLFSTTVDNPLNATAPQETYTVPPVPATIGVEYKIEQYTYFISYRSAAGFESALEELATVNGKIEWDANFTTETPSNQTIIVYGAPVPGDYGRVYRMGGNISVPSLVFQFDSNWTVSLNTSVVTSSGGTFTFALLDHELGGHATTWGAVYPDELQYLTATKYGLAAAKGSQVYLSMNKPDAWSELAMLNLGSKITGIASVYRGFIIFTESAYLYFVTGAGINSLQINLLSTDIGCTSNSTIAEVGQHALVWIYNRRFYMFSGSSVKELEPNTYDYDYFVRNSAGDDITGVSMFNTYFIGSDKGLLALDFDLRYKPFIDYDVSTAFKNDLPMLMRETMNGSERLIGAYKDDGSFWTFKEFTYGDDKTEDQFPPTDNWDMGCYGAVTETDLIMSMSVDKLTPVYNTNVTFTLGVENAGPVTASEVIVTNQLAIGYTYVSDTGAGAYDNATGIWTIGDLAAGATVTLDIVATVIEVCPSGFPPQTSKTSPFNITSYGTYLGTSDWIGFNGSDADRAVLNTDDSRSHINIEYCSARTITSYTLRSGGFNQTQQGVAQLIIYGSNNPDDLDDLNEINWTVISSEIFPGLFDDPVLIEEATRTIDTPGEYMYIRVKAWNDNSNFWVGFAQLNFFE